MDFVKKHYEKILLSVVLLGLMGVLVFMLYLIPRRPAEAGRRPPEYNQPRGQTSGSVGIDAGNECVGAAAIALQTGFFDNEQTVQSGSMAKNVDGRLIRLASGNEVGLAVVTKNHAVVFDFSRWIR